jgi:5-methylcytosine-specific restriction enzyme A
MRPHKLTMLQPRLKELDPLKARGIKTLSEHKRTLKQKQQANGRTLALNGAAWAKLRALILDDEPLCRRCYEHGRVTVATDVDHVDNDASNNLRSNLAALCHECHSRKTAEDMGKTVRHGCDAQGNPLDPAHHWNKSRPTERGEPTGSLHFNANRDLQP